MSDTASLTLGDVAAGQALPPLDYDVTVTTIVLGTMATRDWRPMHHDKDFAINRNGTDHIFMNTPNQAAWFERYVTDWTGPKGRLGRMKFRMKDSIYPGDIMSFTGEVTGVSTDELGCGWANVDVTLKAGERVVTTCSVKVAIPLDADDNPWKRKLDRWQP